MKKKYIATLVAIMLLAGCGTPAPAAPSTTDEPDMETIIQQSVDAAVQEKMKEYEEEQKKKDEEITKLKEQLEDLTAQSEAPPEESSSTLDAGAWEEAPSSGVDEFSSGGASCWAVRSSSCSFSLAISSSF